MSVLQPTSPSLANMQSQIRCALDPAAFAADTLGFAPDPWQQRVLRSNRRQMLLNCSRQSGKSSVSAVGALHAAEYRPGSLTLMISPTQRQSTELLAKAASFLRKLPGAKLDNEFSIAIKFRSGSRLVSLPGTDPDRIRGFSAPGLVIIDEAAFVSDQLYYALRPMMAVGQGKLIAMSTPNGRRGFFFDEWANGGDDWERETITAYECPRIPPAYLERERKRLGDRWFRQEYLCEFLDFGRCDLQHGRYRGGNLSRTGGARYPARVLTVDLFQQSLGLSDPIGFCVGLDLGQARDHSAITVNRKHIELSTGNPFHCIVLSHQFKLGTPYPDVARETAELLAQLPDLAEPPQLFADSTGVGRPLIDLLRGEGLMPFAVTLTAGQHWHMAPGGWISLPKSEMVSTMTVALQRRMVAIAAEMPWLKQMVVELQTYRLSQTTAGTATFNARTEADHDDLVISLGLSIFGASKRWGGPRVVML